MNSQPGLVGETLAQLQTAKKMVEAALTSDGCKATEAYDAVASELDQSRARVNFLQGLVSKLRSAAGQREAELEAALRKSKYEIEELRANLMDKESELQSICEENESLVMQLENTMSGHRERELENTKALLKDKDRGYKNVCEENETLKSEITEIMSELEEARARQRDAVMRIGYLTEEVGKSNGKAGRVSEQLEAAQAANGEMEMELRRLKVQCDQWRKVTEEAACMLWGGDNGQFVSKYSPRINWPYADHDDDDDDDDLEEEDLLKKKKKKKNVNGLKRFGVLWKKTHK